MGYTIRVIARAYYMLDLVALRDPQRGLDKLDRKWYSVNNGGECAAAPDSSKDAQKWPAARRGTKTPPGHASSLLVAPRPIYGASAGDRARAVIAPGLMLSSYSG